MRIERQFPNQAAGVRKAQSSRSGSGFRQTLDAGAARRSEDTLTLSHRAPIAEPRQKLEPRQSAQSGGQAAEQVVISPKDSTEIKLEKLQQIADSVDYAGMSYTEIYTAIWNRYNGVFHGDMSAITSGLWPNPEWSDISSQFRAEVNRFVYRPLEQEIWQDSKLREGDEGYQQQYIAHGGKNFRAEALGLPEGSDEERQIAILQKYMGYSTLREFLNLYGELSETGIIENKLGREEALEYKSKLKQELISAFFPDPRMSPTPSQYNDALNYRMDIGGLSLSMVQWLPEFQPEVSFNVENITGKALDELLKMLDKMQHTKPTETEEEEEEEEQESIQFNE